MLKMPAFTYLKNISMQMEYLVFPAFYYGPFTLRYEVQSYGEIRYFELVQYIFACQLGDVSTLSQINN